MVSLHDERGVAVSVGLPIGLRSEHVGGAQRNMPEAVAVCAFGICKDAVRVS